jgi:hypothetical protein
MVGRLPFPEPNNGILTVGGVQHPNPALAHSAERGARGAVRKFCRAAGKGEFNPIAVQFDGGCRVNPNDQFSVRHAALQPCSTALQRSKDGLVKLNALLTCVKFDERLAA